METVSITNPFPLERPVFSHHPTHSPVRVREVTLGSGPRSGPDTVRLQSCKEVKEVLSGRSGRNNRGKTSTTSAPNLSSPYPTDFSQRVDSD